MSARDITTRNAGPNADAWEDRLSEYLDGELKTAEHEACERHLATCASCRKAVADLRVVVARAQALRAPAAPATDLWPGVAARLQPRPAGRRWWPVAGSWRTRWLVPAVAAAVIVLACVAELLWISRPVPAPISTARTPPMDAARALHATAAHPDSAYEDSVAELRRSAYAKLTADPQLVSILDDNLAALDRAIAEYSDALAENPRDEELERRLAEARRRKLDVLRHAADPSAGDTN